MEPATNTDVQNRKTDANKSKHSKTNNKKNPGDIPPKKTKKILQASSPKSDLLQIHQVREVQFCSPASMDH